MNLSSIYRLKLEKFTPINKDIKPTQIYTDYTSPLSSRVHASIPKIDQNLSSSKSASYICGVKYKLTDIKTNIIQKALEEKKIEKLKVRNAKKKITLQSIKKPRRVIDINHESIKKITNNSKVSESGEIWLHRSIGLERETERKKKEMNRKYSNILKKRFSNHN